MLRQSYTKVLNLLTAMIVAILILSCAGKDQLNSEGHAQYISEQNSLFHITFSYPENWNWVKSADAPDYEIGTLSVKNLYSSFDDPWSGTIVIEVSSKQESPDQARLSMDEHLKRVYLWAGKEKPSWVNLLSDQSLEIDDHYARQIITKIDPRPSLGQQYTVIEEAIFILDIDRYYSFILHIPESEENGRFAEEFKDMLKTIKILP